jgi:hypothetical protein
VAKTLIEQLKQKRVELRTAADAIHTRATEEDRDLTGEELADYTAKTGELRTVEDKIEEVRDAEVAELRAATVAGRGPVLTRADAELARQFRSAIFAKNPAPVEVHTDLTDEWPDDLPEVQGRVGRVKVHTRDTLKSTATQGLGTDVYSRIVQPWSRRPASWPPAPRWSPPPPARTW